ncbi:hypothetical protein HCH_06490 [Hahella chejuensis KCTC 2396]|uniref:Uncharacterized protein n=1 Tax=Hahella chejuensis (strain KCTC 2396) TaxID=349521 RepID=Q2S893_HAHCH|nr:hypothetical protein HCH_06490 [Hahella chejuensis KCTC 2396]
MDIKRRNIRKDLLIIHSPKQPVYTIRLFCRSDYNPTVDSN